MEGGEPLLEGADGPAGLVVEGLGCNLISVEGADVAELDDLVLIVLLEPAQRQSLRAADIGAGLVDAAGAVDVEEGAGASGAWLPGLEQFGEGVADAVGFDLEDGEVVDAAGGASAPAVEVVLAGDTSRDEVDFAVEREEAGAAVH